MHLVDRDRAAPRVGRRARAPCHAPSCQTKLSVRATTEAVEGRSSAAKPNGSAFSGSSPPSAPMISNL